MCFCVCLTITETLPDHPFPSRCCPSNSEISSKIQLGEAVPESKESAGHPEWRQIKLDLPPVKRTRPLRHLLTIYDPREPPTSPRHLLEGPGRLLSPLPPSPGKGRDMSIQIYFAGTEIATQTRGWTDFEF